MFGWGSFLGVVATTLIYVPQTDEDVIHRKYFCVNNHLVSLVELLLEAEENFPFYLFTTCDS